MASSQIIFIALGVLALFYILLWLYQEFWDFRLFEHRAEHEFTMNLSTLQSLGIFKHTPGIVAIDVRPKNQFQAQHLPGALNVPFENGTLDTSEIDGLDRKTPILIYCAGGHRSRRALKSIEETGFKSIYHLNRGIMMWRLFSGPLESSKPE